MSSSPPPPSKRPLMAPSTTAKRSKPPPPPLTIPSNHLLLRFLIPSSLVAAFIGKSGSSIKHLQLETSSKIRIEDSLQFGSDDRVISIVAGLNLVKRLNFDCDWDEIDVSGVQLTAVRVFEKVSEVYKEVFGEEVGGIRVLVDEVEGSCVIGKGGKVVEKMRRESGAKVRVLLGDDLPLGVVSPHQLVQIQGNALAIKKALIGVCSCLQKRARGDESNIKESKSFESISNPTSSFDFHVDPPLHHTPVSVATTSNPALVGKRLFDFDRVMTSDSNSKLQQPEVVYKILCLNDRVGGIIGKGGSIIRYLQDETGASISIGPSNANSDERVVTIISREDVDSTYSPAKRAAVMVFSRYFEALAEKGSETNKGSSVSARLVVPSNQTGCLLGKGGVIISQMRKETGASISIIRGDQVPKCVSVDDAVVEIYGQFVNVRDALDQVASKLRDNLFSDKVVNIPGSRTNTSVSSDPIFLERVGDPTYIGIRKSSNLSQHSDRQATIKTGFDPPLLPHRLDNSPSPGLRASEVYMRTSATVGRALTSTNGLDFCRTKRPTIITNTTVEILVPGSAISSVYGENGSNLARIRQISGAKVVVHEARPGSTDRTVIISGTPDESQAAQSLLHAFILTGT